jgi:acetyltransferase-like isoleucine patch superfamily enzyme
VGPGVNNIAPAHVVAGNPARTIRTLDT